MDLFNTIKIIQLLKINKYKLIVKIYAILSSIKYYFINLIILELFKKKEKKWSTHYFFFIKINKILLLRKIQNHLAHRVFIANFL